MRGTFIHSSFQATVPKKLLIKGCNGSQFSRVAVEVLQESVGLIAYLLAKLPARRCFYEADSGVKRIALVAGPLTTYLSQEYLI